MSVYSSTIGTLRNVVGGASLLAPTTTAKLFGLGQVGDTYPTIVRLFGARELALGLAALQTDEFQLASALKFGVLVDAIDTVSTVKSYRDGKLGKFGLLACGSGAVSFVVLGVAALREL